MQLLIMAAGMGSRFGGLKQIAPMGPNEEFIIDYSIYDAIKAGFSKVVFIIKEENYEVFKDTIGKRVEGKIPVEYAFQRIDDIPSFVKKPEDREKPWGTAQAIYAARDKITEPFLVINADDFYGRDAFMTAKDFINSGSDEYATIGYEAKKTMTENGSVKRGVIDAEDGYLKSITESKLEFVDGKILASPLDGSEPFQIEDSRLVAMNMFIFDLTIFPFIKEKMDKFFKENENNLNNCEFLIPVEIGKAVQSGEKKVKILSTTAEWYGVTYKEDVDGVKDSIKRLVLSNEYPNNLWK